MILWKACAEDIFIFRFKWIWNIILDFKGIIFSQNTLKNNIYVCTMNSYAPLLFVHSVFKSCNHSKCFQLDTDRLCLYKITSWLNVSQTHFCFIRHHFQYKISVFNICQIFHHIFRLFKTFILSKLLSRLSCIHDGEMIEYFNKK